MIKLGGKEQKNRNMTLLPVHRYAWKSHIFAAAVQRLAEKKYYSRKVIINSRFVWNSYENLFGFFISQPQPSFQFIPKG